MFVQKKRVLSLMLVFALIFGDICIPTVDVCAETQVYVTATGSKYHARKCGRGNFSLTSLSNAKARGLSPCSKCFPGGEPKSSNSSSSSKKKKTTKKKEETFYKTIEVTSSSKLTQEQLFWIEVKAKKGVSIKVKITDTDGKAFDDFSAMSAYESDDAKVYSVNSDDCKSTNCNLKLKKGKNLIGVYVGDKKTKVKVKVSTDEKAIKKLDTFKTDLDGNGL